MTGAAAALVGTCHCGAVTVRIPRQPETLTDCDCSLCRRHGARWAYFDTSEVAVDAAAGATTGYARGPRTIRFVRCATCGCVTHWEPIVAERGTRMGVNARLFDPASLASVRIRRLDGAITERYLD